MGLKAKLTSKERVKTVFEFKEPDRVPRWCGAIPEFWEKAKKHTGLDDEALRQLIHDDFRRVVPNYVGPEMPVTHPNATYATPFGIEREGLGYGQPLSHPLADATLEQVNEYPWPKAEWFAFDHVPGELAPYKDDYAILGGAWCPYLHDAIDLLGMEKMMLRMMTEPEVVHAVIKHIVDFYYSVTKNMFEAHADDIDIFFLGNDFGTQLGPMFSNPMFDEFMKPPLKRLCDLGHSFGLKNMIHCCGGFEPLMPAMIDAGIDGVQALQPSARGMEPTELKKKYGGKIVLNGAIDSHHVLIDGTPDSTREATREVLSIMMPGGGYIASASHDTLLEETPVENVLAMFEAIEEFGYYG